MRTRRILTTMLLALTALTLESAGYPDLKSTRLAVSDGKFHCSILIPAGWFIQASKRTDFRLIYPKGDDARTPVTSIYLYVVARAGRSATRPLSTDEYVQTADHQRALIRHFIVNDSQPFNPNIPRLNPCAVGYGEVASIEESDRLVEVVLGSDYDHFAKAKAVFDEVVRSYVSSK